MDGLMNLSTAIAIAPGTADLRCDPDEITDYGWTHRWEAYAVPNDIGATASFLEDLIGNNDATPNGGGGQSGATAGVVGFQNEKICLQLGGTNRYATGAFTQGAACTMVGLVRPKGDPYPPGTQNFLFAKSAGSGARNVWLDGQAWAINGGSTLTLPNSVKNADWQVVTAVFNGPSSVLRVDGQEVTGNAGTDAPTGLTIGATAALLPAATLTAWFAAAYFAPRALTFAERTAFESEVRRLHRLPAI